MLPIHALILGVVEGLTEFLPVSSTGHMILTMRALGIPQTNFTKSFEILIQLGAIAAVAVAYRKKIVSDRKIILPVAAAFVPTAVIGFIAYKAVKTLLLGNEWVTVAALAVGGVAFIAMDRLWAMRQDDTSVGSGQIRTGQAVAVGLAQALSVIPGVSRSAASIFGGMAAGLTRQEAVEFSFLLAIPTMLAASALDIAKSGIAFSLPEWQLIGIGFLTAFVTALVAIRGFLAYVRRHPFTAFGVYRIAIAAVFWWFFLR